MKHLKRIFAGAEAGSRLVGFEYSNFGQIRWHAEGRPLEEYQITVLKVDFMEAIQPAYDEWLEMQKEDDVRHPDEMPNIFEQLGYPPLAEFMEHRAEFSEFVINLAPCPRWKRSYHRFHGAKGDSTG